ncbi:Cna B-type domain-containing protein [Atopobiaceae bacterium HCP3S3_F7]
MTRRETRPVGFAGRTLAAVVVVLAVMLAAVPATARAQVSIARGTVCSLEVEKCPAEGQSFHLALVAQMDASGRLAAVPALADAVDETGVDPATFGEDTDAQTLANAAASYAGYVASASGSFAEKNAVATDGKAAFTGLEPGMYLLTADPATVGGSTFSALPNLVVVPRVDGSTYATDCQVDTKFEVRPVEMPHNRVTKLWQGDSASSRPASVRVAIYNGDELYQEVTLGASNNWTFAWDGEGSWSVCEKDVPAGYTCSVLAARGDADSDENGMDFTLANTVPGDGHEAPRTPGSLTNTGDPTSPVVPVVLLCAGGALVLLGIVGRRREEGRACPHGFGARRRSVRWRWVTPLRLCR